jgi:hypothetical protein
MSRKGKWAGFRIRREDGEFYEIELNDRGQLLEPPPRLRRRRTPYSEERSFECPPLRVARLTGTPPVSLNTIVEEGESPLFRGELEEDNEVFKPSEKANPGPYTGLLDESFSNDSFSFGFGDEFGVFDPFFLGF